MCSGNFQKARGSARPSNTAYTECEAIARSAHRAHTSSNTMAITSVGSRSRHKSSKERVQCTRSGCNLNRSSAPLSGGT
eukprot:4868167-Amphidinium_carterae.1